MKKEKKKRLKRLRRIHCPVVVSGPEETLHQLLVFYLIFSERLRDQLRDQLRACWRRDPPWMEGAILRLCPSVKCIWQKLIDAPQWAIALRYKFTCYNRRKLCINTTIGLIRLLCSSIYFDWMLSTKKLENMSTF